MRSFSSWSVIRRSGPQTRRFDAAKSPSSPVTRSASNALSVKTPSLSTHPRTHRGRHRLHPAYRARRSIFRLTLVAVFLSGCGPRDTRIELESRLNPDLPNRFAESFDEAIYATDGRGRWDIVLCTSRPAARDAGQIIEQLLHINLFWKPVPGTTYAESSQTNALITYCLSTGFTAIGYEGAGFVYVDVNPRTLLLLGRIESSSLTPSRRTKGAPDRFGPCRVSGQIRATRNDGRVAELLGRMNSRLGPRPPVDPRAGAGDVR